MEILHFEDLGDTSVISECSLDVNLVIDNFFVCSFRYFTSVNNLKAIGYYSWRRFGGYECRLAANAIVLVLGGYQISIATY